jgi:hypothetical protein
MGADRLPGIDGKKTHYEMQFRDHHAQDGSSNVAVQPFNRD